MLRILGLLGTLSTGSIAFAVPPLQPIVVDDVASDDPDPQRIVQVGLEPAVADDVSSFPVCHPLERSRSEAFTWADVASAELAITSPGVWRDGVRRLVWLRIEARTGTVAERWIQGPYGEVDETEFTKLTVPTSTIPGPGAYGTLSVQVVVETADGRPTSSVWLPRVVYTSDGELLSFVLRDDFAPPDLVLVADTGL